ncbi:unnamed protein product [Caenorhabditis angaria]|uniref:Seminal fluid protein n=1 Tax=Caenorhabditis angaria TaxID=860376 RepID=A0A9P1ICM7_9PELO|nr:unnamed protein product [Caenorhabditis angaria]
MRIYLIFLLALIFFHVDSKPSKRSLPSKFVKDLNKVFKKYHLKLKKTKKHHKKRNLTENDYYSDDYQTNSEEFGDGMLTVYGGEFNDKPKKIAGHQRLFEADKDEHGHHTHNHFRG